MFSYALYGDRGAATRKVLDLLQQERVLHTFSLTDDSPGVPVLCTPVGHMCGYDEIRHFVHTPGAQAEPTTRPAGGE